MASNGLKNFTLALRNLRLYKPNAEKYLVGTDKFGNRYYENPGEIYGKHRWVVYDDKVWAANAEPLLVPPEWHHWLHRFGDKNPSVVKPEKQFFEQDPSPNPTGSADTYYPTWFRLNKKFNGRAINQSEKIETWRGKATPKLDDADERWKM
eukprot:TRINITY_DN15024_c0_g1::TRINITY_DN15024_c0_g1_i1::g.25854::m.25854 TRINITY_DN15024_c0_g1::TRINITY_DN15024_c0_g1_i1::g.25854  ORF type:complete len:160 (+),score=16.66,sp/Q54MV7/NDUAC_DICDI/43.69/9e-20,NDUFA12/PF05071.11/2.2e-22 TRINITY_DN15024_c0_g1_i1:29-481(+)